MDQFRQQLPGIRTVAICLALVGAMLFAGIPAVADPVTGEDFVLGPTTPGKWGAPAFGTGATVTYSFMGSGLTTDLGAGTSVALGTFMPLGFTAAIQAAFNAWSAVANITFNLVADPGVGWESPGAGASDIRITGHAIDGASGTLAHGFFPPANGVFAAGDIHFDSAENWVLGQAGPGIDIFSVAAHEIGHAIGLSHELTVTALMNPFYTEAFLGLQADDIAGAQFIYGAPVTTPEPSTFLLLGVALIGFFGVRRQVKVLG